MGRKAEFSASPSSQRVSFLREEEMPCPRSPILSNSPWQERLVAGTGAGPQRVPAHGTEMGQAVQGTLWVWTRWGAGDPQVVQGSGHQHSLETPREPLISGTHLH